ncbi:MAG: hypothetical protein QJR00_04615 [Bacillota bacterium]|nr:hypothetical protein [Bacillota bacterium]
MKGWMTRVLFLFFRRRPQGALLLLLLTAAAQMSLAALWHGAKESGGQVPRVEALEIPLGAQAALFWPEGRTAPLKDIRVAKSLLLQAVESYTSQGTLIFLLVSPESRPELGWSPQGKGGFLSCGQVPSLAVGSLGFQQEGSVEGCEKLFGRSVITPFPPPEGEPRGTWELLWLYPGVDPQSFRWEGNPQVWTPHAGETLLAASLKAGRGPLAQAAILLLVASALAVGNGALIGYFARRQRYGALAAAGVAGDELGFLLVGDTLLAVAAGSLLTLLLAGALSFWTSLHLLPEVCYSIPLTFLAALLGVVRPFQVVKKEEVLDLLYEERRI